MGPLLLEKTCLFIALNKFKGKGNMSLEYLKKDFKVILSTKIKESNLILKF